MYEYRVTTRHICKLGRQAGLAGGGLLRAYRAEDQVAQMTRHRHKCLIKFASVLLPHFI